MTKELVHVLLISVFVKLISHYIKLEGLDASKLRCIQTYIHISYTRSLKLHNTLVTSTLQYFNINLNLLIGVKQMHNEPNWYDQMFQ